MSNDTVISNRTPVAKARCPECDTEQPRTLFVGAICLFCKQGIASKLARDAQLGTLTPGSELQDAQTIARKRLSEMRKRLHEEREHAEQVIARAKVAEASDEAARQAGVDAELARRTLAQRHLLPFVVRHNPDYLPGWVHQDICEHLEWFSLQVAAKLSPRLMICMPPRHGKQLADSTKVLTTRGWSTHGELQVGDEVFHPSGQPVRVEAVSDKTPSDYVVTLTDGSCIRCHANHEWVVYDRPRRKWITVETRWFTDTTRHGVQRKLSTGPIGKRGGRYKYQLPAIAAVQYPEATLPMPPYVLGAWLGDGSRGKPCITHDINDAAVAQAIAQYGYEITSVCTHPQTGVKTTYFSSPKIGALSCFREQLRSLGLDDGAKFIPEMYLRSSMAQRLALLAGLMDTDGHNDGVTGRCRIVTADEALASSLADLCTGLGFRPYVTTATPTLSTSGIQGKKACYTVGFQPTMDIPCVLPRKRPTRVISQRRVAIQSVEYRPNGEQGHCIEVSSADGLYLAGDRLTPTHNSALASVGFPGWHLGNYPEHEVMACSYNSALAMSFSRKVRNLVREPAYQVVFDDMRLDPDSQSVETWHTTEGGMYAALGVGGPATGRGAHVLLIDDPVKNRAEAESETSRDAVWDWYTCFRPGTEVLTEDGWKPVETIRRGELLATMNPADETMYYAPATDTQSYDFDGNMIELDQRRGGAFSVTPNHNVWFRRAKDSPLESARADDLPKQFYLPRAPKHFAGYVPPQQTGFKAQHPNGKDFLVDTGDWVELIGRYLGDGSCDPESGTVVLSCVKPRKRAAVEALLSRMGIAFWYSNRAYQFRNVLVARYLATLGHAHEKYIPRAFLKLDKPYLQRLMDGLMGSDGSCVSATQYRYVTVSIQLADDVAEVAVKCGYAVAMSTHPASRKKGNRRDSYHLSLTLRPAGSHVSKHDASAPLAEVGYEGKVYCVTVPPYHTVLIRYKGRVSWSGQSTAYTRLAPGGGVIVILTRWHDDDLAGRLLRAQKDGGDQWRVISYPAVAEVDEPYRNRGEALHPARYNLEALERIKRAVGPRDWQALYQQNPVADDGDYFTKNMISYYSQADLPDWDSMRFYTCWDLAIGQKDMNDWSVGITVGMDRKDDLYIIDIQRGRWGTLELADKILDVYETWRSSITGIERGQIEMAIGPFLDKRKRERSLPSFAYEPLSPRRGDKVARARSIQGRMMQHRVKFRRNCDVTNTLINELLRFPNGVNDDQCFVEGTLIDTPDGAKPIEALRIGDLVSTPYGAFPVEVAACTGVRDTSEIVFSDGTRLEGTGNHPVFTLNRGFVAIDNIDYADIMVKNIRGTETSTVTMTSVRATGKSVPVYNLCVRDIPVYFANGILVHNCDALAYIGLLLDEFVTPRIQAPAKQKSWRDKLDHYVKGRQSHGFMGA